MAKDTSVAATTDKFEVEVFGADLDGYQFIEQTRTLTITRGGATIPLANKLAPDSELIVRNPATNEEAIARVVDLMRDSIFVHVYAIAFADPSVNLWKIEFPEAQSKETILMECSRCLAVDAVLPSEIEREIFESKQTLSRHCECSNSSTIWRPADRRAADRRAAEREAGDRRRKTSPIQDSITSVAQEKRKEKRTAMKVLASIRRNGTEEIVECEDISRGGFRFKSRETYHAGLLIEAAVPYSKNSNNIYVLTRIAYQQKLASGFYRHGVTYVKSI